MTEKGTFLIIDGSSLLYRAFFALPLLQTRQGLYTNAVYGFTSMLLKVLEEEKPDYVVVAFDKAAPTFRHQEYAEYKGKRDKTPGELSEQISHVREVLAALHIPIVETEGFEADDLIGTLAQTARKKDIRPLIVSGDADIFQLVDIPAEVIYTKRGITQVERYTEEKLQERYGLTAQQYIDFKGLKGDASDNIPGVPSVGEKTAIKLLTQFGTMEKIYENLEQIKGKLQTTLAEHKEQAFLSKRLATIVKDVPMEESVEDFARQEADTEKLRRVFEQLEFNSLLDKLAPADGQQEPSQKQLTEASILVEGEDELVAFRRAIEDATRVAILVFPVALSWQDKPDGFSVAVEDKTFYVPVADQQELVATLEILLSTSASTVVYDAKLWRNLCWRNVGKEVSGKVFDVSLAAYLLDPLENGYPPEKLAQRYLDRSLPELAKKKKGEEVCHRDYSCSAARTLYDLDPLLTDKLREVELENLYLNLELPLTKTLAKMERVGVAVDPVALDNMKVEFKERIAGLEEEIFSQAGEKFNLNSPKQLGHILFDKLGLPALKKTKTGYSTDAKVLEELGPHHDVVAKILQYRTLIKILTTYLEGLSKLINEETGRIHTHFNQTVTATGRLSSTEPNLQNIPIRLEEGRRVRRAFVPGKKGNLLLSADYSQIELRILAHVSQDAVLIDSFCKEEDIHRRTAAEVFGVDPQEVTHELRDRAKAVNFGIIYGISDYGLSQQLKIPRQEAKQYIERYFERLPGVRDFINSVVQEAKKNGYVTTLLNRRRYLPDINARNFNQRSFAERTAMNTPIQGTAADIIKLAMLKVEQALEGVETAQMILQVHDDLVFEVREDALQEVALLVKKEMESALDLAVPLTVDVKAGSNWAEMNKVNL